MKWQKRLYIGGKACDLRHPFDEELDYFVRTNHWLVMDSISRIEVGANPQDEDDKDYSEELKRAANNLALVALLTRLHHWISILIEEFAKKSVREKSLVSNLNLLNKHTCPGPTPIEFFRQLATVRDSIIHADSRIAWTFKGDERRVADRYANFNSGDIEFTATDLEEAIENSVLQVRWYHDKLDALEASDSGKGTMPDVR